LNDEIAVGADHRIAGHQASQLRFRQGLRAGGALRHHQIAQFGRAVPDPDFNIVVDLNPELGQHTARIAHDPRPVGRGLVPVGRNAQNRKRITGAQRANDEIVDVRSVLDNFQMRRRVAQKSEFIENGRRILQQACAEHWIAPGPGDDQGAAPGSDILRIGLHPGVDGAAVDKPFFDQQTFKRFHPQCRFRREMRMQILVNLRDSGGIV